MSDLRDWAIKRLTDVEVTEVRDELGTERDYAEEVKHLDGNHVLALDRHLNPHHHLQDTCEEPVVARMTQGKLEQVLVNSLGLSDRNITALTLHLEVGQAPAITFTEVMPSIDDSAELAEVIKTYTLVAKNGD